MPARRHGPCGPSFGTLGVAVRGVRALAVVKWRALRAGRSFAAQLEHERATARDEYRDAIDDAKTRGVPLRQVLEERGLV